MRSEEEIEAMYDAIDITPDMPRANTFEFGMLVGKIYALEWVREDMTSGEFQVSEDFEDYLREQKFAAEEIKRLMDEPPTSKPQE